MGSQCGLPSVAALRLVREQLETVNTLRNALREQDVEAVHEIRVASRRIRVILAEFADVWEGSSRRAVRDEMRAITKALGLPRECDVCLRLLETLRMEAKGDAGPVAALADAWKADRKSHDGAVLNVAVLLESQHLQDLIETLLARFKRSSRCFRKLAGERLNIRRSDAIKAYRKWDRKPTEERLHTFRVSLKKLRYACEALRDVFDPEAMEAALERLRNLQKKLGEWHDWHVFGVHLESFLQHETARSSKSLERMTADAAGHAKGALEAFREEAGKLFSKKGPDFPGVRPHACKQVHRRKIRKDAQPVAAQE